MRSAILSTAAVVLAGLQTAQAQTFSACNPMKKTCPPDPALGTSVFYDFTKTTSLPADWSALAGTTPQFSTTEGLEFVINTNTNAPTIAFTKYIMFGKVEVYVKASNGGGIVSSVILLSDDLDEIDFEFTGSNDAAVQTNFFGKGNTTLYNREQDIAVANSLTSVHKYTIVWTKDQITWMVDDNAATARTLPYNGGSADLTNGGYNYPQTPMQVKLGNWVGCPTAECFNDATCPTHGTCQWVKGYYGQTVAGPYVMSITNITISDYSCGTEYGFGDMSGMFSSIQGASSCVNSTTSTVTSGAPSSTSSSSEKLQTSGAAPPLNLGQGNATITGQGNATVTSGVASTTGGMTSSTSTAPISTGSNIRVNSASSLQAQLAVVVFGLGAVAALLM